MSIKKGWKITWIALGSLLGLVVVTVVVALWLVFTPSKLTKIVNGLVGNFITCDAKFGNVDLTLLSTFPDAGLKIEDVVIVNPGKGPIVDYKQNDTVAKIGSLTVGIDVKAFLKENKVIVHQVVLEDATANLFIDSLGTANFDIFPKSDDTTSSETKLPEVIDLKKIKIDNLNATFLNCKDGMMSAEVAGMDMNLKGSMEQEDIVADLKLGINQLFFVQGEVQPMLTAHVKGLEMKADGKKEGEHIDADIRIDGKNVDLDQVDSLGNHTLKAVLDGLLLKAKGNGDMDTMRCKLDLGVEKGTLNAAGIEMVNETLRESKKDLLGVEMPDVVVKLNKKEIWLSDSKIKLDDYALMLNGQCYLATEERPLTMDMAVETDGSWRVKPLLDIVPERFVGFRKGMEQLDGDVAFVLNANGTLTDSTMPNIVGNIRLADGRFYAPKMLPYKINKVKGELGVDLNLDKRKESHVTIKNLKAHTQGTDVMLNGRVDDLLGDMRVDAKVKGTLPLEDVKPMLPKTMNIELEGDADVDVSAKFAMSQLKKQAYDKMKASGTVKFKGLQVDLDTIHATAPDLAIALQLPATEHKGRMADVKLKGSALKAKMGKGISAEVKNPDISVGVNNMMKEQLAVSFKLGMGETEANVDSMIFSLVELKLDGSMRMDSLQKDVLKKFNPRLNAETRSALVFMPQLPEAVRLRDFDMSYTPELIDIREAKVTLGHSDFELYGTVDNFEEWLDNKVMLKGDLNFTSDYADVDQIMNMFSGMGSDPDTLEALRKEDAVPAEANPFIVPKNVNVTLHTHIKRSIAFGNDLHDVAGALTVKDGRMVLDQMGFVCKAATMQLTALYKSDRPGHLFTALDFHLLDIQIDELLDMIPAVDTLVPMLSAFNGNANFHLAAETYLDARYQPKLPTLKGAAAITGENLVVMDNKDIATIAKLMRFKSWKDKDNKIKVDSLSVEMVAMDDGHGCEVEIFPFLLNVGSYQVCISGLQGVDKSCNYHLELLKNPLLAKVGVDVKGSILSPKISLGKVLYADLFRPKKQGVAEKRALEVKRKVREALEANVR
ncbi:MAG: hypothetical protein IKN29_09125 [Bacteroidales bacterium]|nr:hypothetical protein [Bacteroidales bacterium]